MSYQREFEKRLRIGFVGVGSHVYRNLLPALTYLPVELVAICDVNEELSRKTATQYGVDAVYTDANDLFAHTGLDAVFLAVSPILHPELTQLAFDAGLHVWMEKPPATRAFQVEDMLRHQGDRVCVVGFKKAFMPAADKVAEVFAIPEYGPLKSIAATYPMSMPLGGRKLLDDGKYTNNLCHPLSLMMRIGGAITTVTTHRGGLGGGCIVFEFASGALGNLHMAAGAGRGQPDDSYSFYGNNLHVEINNAHRVTVQRGIPFVYEQTTSYAPEGLDHGALVWEPQNNKATLDNMALFTQGFYREMRYFCDCILDSRKPELGSLDFSLELMKVHEAALISEGDPVTT